MIEGLFPRSGDHLYADICRFELNKSAMIIRNTRMKGKKEKKEKEKMIVLLLMLMMMMMMKQ